MRLAVISDVHANLPAVEAVLADIARRGADLTIDLGDRVGGPLWPAETFALLAEVPGVRGNHDRWVAERARDALGPWDRLAFDTLGEAERTALLALPERLEITPGVVAFHANPHNDADLLTEQPEGGRLVMLPPSTVADRLDGLSARLFLCGHSHVPRVMQLPGGALVVNPGSVGCPAYRNPHPPAHVHEMGAPHARYALVDVAPGAISVALISVPYDVERAARRAEETGYPDWVRPLTTGTMG
jgi:predicted phosphodiesterase